MATHSSILAWRIPWTEEPGGLQSTRKESDTAGATFMSLTFTWPRDWTQVPHIAGKFFVIQATREALPLLDNTKLFSKVYALMCSSVYTSSVYSLSSMTLDNV